MASSIESSSIWKDISSIIYSPPNNVFIDNTVTIHTELEDYNALGIANLDIIRDYVKNIGDHIHLTFMISMGDYVRRFYPFKNNLEITLTTSIIVPNDSKKVPKLKQRYKVVFLPNHNKHIDASEHSMMDKETLDHSDMIMVNVQLLDRALEPLRIKMTAGIYSNAKVETVLRSIITNEAKQILVDGKPCLDSVDIYPPDNSEVQKHIILPTGTHVLDIPTYIQEKMNGIYSSGLGSYFQTYNGKKTYFIYPLFNTQRYSSPNTSTAKAIFYFMPSYRYQGIDNTYTVDGSLLKIACTANKQYVDDGETNYMNSGVGFLQADARTMMAKPIVISVTGPVGNPAKTTTFVANKSRADGLNYAPVSKHGISSNPFLQYSVVSSRDISRLDIEWQHSDPSLIYPGMPCEFVFLDNGKRSTIRGIIAFTQTSVVKVNSGITTNMLISNTLVTIFAERRPKIILADKSTPVQL